MYMVCCLVSDTMKCINQLMKLQEKNYINYIYIWNEPFQANNSTVPNLDLLCIQQ